ncbi:hypothetical protein CerSpe_272320 [Prunus speciosa]
MGSEDDPEMLFRNGRFCAPGFRFHPTDEELVVYYLKRKICKKRLKLNVIAETDVYKWDPEELPGLSLLKTGDRQWFFFSPRDRKYPNGGRSNRATRHGYWKATGKDRNITCYSRSVGLKKTLVYYKGRAPSGERTDWVMHEYTLDEEELKRCRNVQEYYALYKVYKKSGPGPKNGEQYGAPFREEEWADDELPVVNSSADRQIPVKQSVDVISVDPVKVNGEVHSALSDIEEFMKQIADEAVLELPQMNGYAYTIPQAVSEEETQSAVVDLYSREVVCPEPNTMFNPSDHQCNLQASFDFTQSDTSQIQLYEASEVTTSAPEIHEQGPPILREEDFLEMDDLLGPEPTISNIENPVVNLQFEGIDGLSEFDLYHDAAMFFHDMGPFDQGTVSHQQYMNSLGNNIVGQFEYQVQPIPPAVNQVNHQLNPESTQMNNQLWTHTERAEPNQGFLSYSTSGVVYEPSNFASQANQNQSGNEAAGGPSQFSSALWAFVESIPTTPASASENALVNRAFERMSSFSRLRINSVRANVTAGSSSEAKRAGRKRSFFFLPVLVALCAIFWVFMGTLRPWWRCLSA